MRNCAKNLKILRGRIYNKCITISKDCQKRKCRPTDTALETKDEDIVEEQDILSRGTEYIGDLFDDTDDMLVFDEDKDL